MLKIVQIIEVEFKEKTNLFISFHIYKSESKSNMFSVDYFIKEPSKAEDNRKEPIKHYLTASEAFTETIKAICNYINNSLTISALNNSDNFEYISKEEEEEELEKMNMKNIFVKSNIKN